ncbi:Ubiquitin carboxyl-terminal hydrolase 46 [Heterocephalus glaber]|uniref:ubiquitinyl hydrolase 1 n=1 Tax=Heterocephalus glaber TaxID=10181 RepID=G5BXS6_HETGA|nr:Ubiquitin carboxyl-terminal hydrolase 46 [Heterocephalus glaber]
MQQDAHEFFNYLLNTIADILQEEKKEEKQNGKLKNDNMNEPAENNKPELTWIHEIFQGMLTNETQCLNCETVSSKDEDFLDLSVNVEQNTSIIHFLRDFSNTETLCSEQKYYCETCCSKQKAQKRMRVKKLPVILALHLKWFKYMEQLHSTASLKVTRRVFMWGVEKKNRCKWNGKKDGKKRKPKKEDEEEKEEEEEGEKEEKEEGEARKKKEKQIDT